MKTSVLRLPALVFLCGLIAGAARAESSLSEAVARDYDAHLGDLFVHFHRHPELSFMEHKTAARLAAELREAGFAVTENVGGTGIVALLENGPGPRVMMRADMDGLSGAGEKRSALRLQRTADRPQGPGGAGDARLRSRRAHYESGGHRPADGGAAR